MRTRRYTTAAVLAVCATRLAGCGSTATEPASGANGPAPNATAPPGFPLEITNCGQTQTFEKPPTRAASMDQISTELLLYLNLERSIVGAASRSGEIFGGGAGFPSLTDAYAQVPVLAANYPSQEILLNAAPDFVTGNSDAYTFGPTTEGGTGFTRADMASQGIRTYTFLCKGEEATNDLLFSRYEESGRTEGGSGSSLSEWLSRCCSRSPRG